LGGYRFDAELDTGIAMNLMLGDCLERMKEIPDGVPCLLCYNSLISQ